MNLAASVFLSPVHVLSAKSRRHLAEQTGHEGERPEPHLHLWVRDADLPPGSVFDDPSLTVITLSLSFHLMVSAWMSNKASSISRKSHPTPMPQTKTPPLGEASSRSRTAVPSTTLACS